jgi:putative 4-mercaptohistidine N1-methyltranferase
VSNFYENDQLVDQYLLFHYGTADDQLPFRFGPRDALFYPIRCVNDFLPAIGTVERALDLGCAVGRSTFELSGWVRQVVGIDLLHCFIAAANGIRETGKIEIRRTEEGEVVTWLVRELALELDRERCQFEVGDATCLRKDIAGFDVVLAANLIDRVKSPRDLLKSFSALVHPGGHLILSSPYTWLEEFTPKSAWLGGNFDTSGQATSTLERITNVLEDSFDLKQTKDMPFVIREHGRKFQWSVAQATVWRRQ